MKKLNSLIIGSTLAIAAASTNVLAYTNISPEEAHDAVINSGAYILDVRTDSEFTWVGHPNVPNVLNISYKIVNKDLFILNPSFISDMNDIFDENKDAKIIAMCRSGKRSVGAAEALEAAGYTNVYNMVDGFEGGTDVDGYGYRTTYGWKNIPLPGLISDIGAYED